jgi:diadenosine tetraphosphatase ApaH/serine/threonine PP2A family protein phosphatase
MKMALLADIHSNLEALGACLAHAEAGGAERWAFLGDLVGYNADPVAVLDIVMAYAAGGASVVLGNHDQAALGRSAQRMNENAERAMEWTRARLRPEHVAFLSSLPLAIRDGERLYVHASAAAPERWTYVSSALRAQHCMAEGGAAYTLCGHVHAQRLYFLGADARAQPVRPTPGTPIPVPPHRRWLAIVGSCGQPRDGNTAACYAVLDTDRAELTFHRLSYDHDVTARKIRAAGLPERLAERIERGQ